MVLAGGAGERLYPLTKERAKPAVYFGGPYRIIDFTLSNCINSGLRKIFIALQYKSLSLSRHLRTGWSVVADELGEFIEILSPQKRVGEHWYLGTADAVYQNLYSILREEPRQLLVLSGDHVYKMDYARMLRFHADRGAGATLAAIEIASEEANRFGILEVDNQDRLTDFLEKPEHLPRGQTVLASMGIYIFDMRVLVPATSARWTHISTQTWICAASIRSSTCTIRSGRSARIRSRRPQRSSCLPTMAADAVRRWTRSFPPAASSQGARSRAACSARTFAFTAFVTLSRAF
jgi:ADP-glucose pyrophosphorylase